MKNRKNVILIAILIISVAASLAAASRIVNRISHDLADANAARIRSEIVGRVAIIGEKLIGHLPQLSWYELAKGAWPGKQLGDSWRGSGFISIEKYMEARSFDASVVNPFGDPESVAEGRKLFQERCVACHGYDGKGAGHAPSLTRANYRIGASDFAIYRVLRDGIEGTRMAAPDLSISQRWDIVSYLRMLQIKDKKIDVPEVRAPQVNVTWQDLLDAKRRTSDWLTYSGSLDGWRHSNLKQITPANASGLKLIWAHQFEVSQRGAFAATPLVVNKTIFMGTPPNDVVALNAETGEEIWRFQHDLPADLAVCCESTSRGLAVLGDTLFFATLDAKLIALDATTGAVRWQTSVAETREGYTITVAPLIAKDAVVVGISGGEFGVRGFLSAYGAADGKLRWRFNTIPGPGEFGSDTWKNDAWKTGGGPTWVTGSFDPELNLLYWGVGNPSPNYAGSMRPGDNLFTNSVVALDGDTGKLAWHFQFTPHDAHDWDSNQTPILADLTVNGAVRKVICWANRNGFYYVLDRTNGEFLAGKPFVQVTWASGLDAKGRPVVTKNNDVPLEGVETRPWVGGGTNWLPPSYDPATGTVFVHATDGSSIYTAAAPEHVARGVGGIFVGSGSSAAVPAVNYVIGLEAATGNLRWKYTAPRVPEHSSYSGTLSTAGGVVFSVADGVILALDAKTGTELWKANLGGKGQSTPISFELNGKQVVEVTAGNTMFLFGL